MLGNSLISHKFVHLLPASLRSNLTRHRYRHPVCSRSKFKLTDERLPCSQFFHPLFYTPDRRCLVQFKVHATATETDQPKWWEKNGPNMIDIHYTEEFLDALSQAGDRLVIVDFYGAWCASCRALFPKLCKLAEEHPEILFLKVNFDENKSLCKSLNIKVLPYFHFYRGADRLLDSFSCSLAKIQKLKDAIATYNVTDCSAQISLKDNEDGSPDHPS